MPPFVNSCRQVPVRIPSVGLIEKVNNLYQQIGKPWFIFAAVCEYFIEQK